MRIGRKVKAGDGGSGKAGGKSGSVRPREKSGRINVPRLIAEIVVVVIAVGALCMWKLTPVINKRLAERDPYEKYNALYKEVQAYDYSKGRDADLEYRVDQGVKKVYEDDYRNYFAYMARGYYYCSLGLSYVGARSYHIAMNFAPESGLDSDAIMKENECKSDAQKAEEADNSNYLPEADQAEAQSETQSEAQSEDRQGEEE